MGEKKLVRPRDAASLILLRQGRRGVEVLIGRRGKSARFMPGRYVFPGGRAVPEDARAWTGELADAGTPAFLALKRAALRETFEETGLLIGEPRLGLGAPNGPLSAIEEAYCRGGVAPAPHLLRLVGRAITPTASPIRFHARFFVADGRHALGALVSGEELDDVHWHPVDGEPPDAMQNVTKFMLRCAVEAWSGAAPATPPLYWHRGRKSLVRRGAPAR
jgi:8-oxo-dGTP pyrophosphatase MutT (NUDIX family)